MSVRIEMPSLSSEGESATLATWLVSVGDRVEAGDVIAELETDKSTVELEAPASGTITSIAIAAGTEDVAPGAVLGEIDAGESTRPETGSSSRVTEAMPETPAPAPAAEEVGAPSAAESAASPGAGPGGVPRATPLARRAAEAKAVDLERISGSGPGGRIVEADVLEVAGGEDGPSADVDRTRAEGASRAPEPANDAAQGFQVTRLSAMRKTIARRLTESKQQVPHFYLQTSVGMDEVLAVRARLNTGLAEEGRSLKISVNDFIVRASALALRDVPAANVQFAGDAMHVFDRVDISVAVATDGGLVTPVVRDADRKGLTTLAEEVKSLAHQAREGSLKPDQYQGGTFTISNLGMYGIDAVFPILNPPEACILGVGAAAQQPVVRGGEIVVGRIATLALAADHRAVDGAVGAELLSAIRDRLEDPMGMML